MVSFLFAFFEGMFGTAKPLFFVWLFLASPFSARCQFFSFSQSSYVQVLKDGTPLSHPWTGAYNSSQFWPCDMNNDGIEDMLVFDKTSNRVLVFLAQVQGQEMVWKFAPDYIDLVPQMQSWMATADFNCDGRMDLFTQTSLGIKVFRNISGATNQAGFALEIDGLQSQGFSGTINVQVNPYGAPAITDVDGDGDLDVLAFDFSGNTVEYHQNRIKDLTGSCAGFNLKKDSCVFGRFATLPACGTIKINTGCYGQKPGPIPGPSPERIAHIGSQLAAMDLDGDGDKDLLVGDLGCPLLNRLVNGGSPQNALITASDTLFPSASQYIKMPVFPSAYSMDVNFDGRNDLIVTPTTFSNISENNVVNTRAATHVYLDQGQGAAPIFQFLEKDFLQNQTIDLGEESMPALADVDADGDMDLVVGHRGLKNGNLLEASLYFFRNVGTSLSPRFALENTNFLNIASLSRKRIRPLFTDINGDGATDFAWVSSPSGTSDSTRLHYLLNQNDPGQPFSFPSVSSADMLNFSFSGYDCPVFFTEPGGARVMLVGKMNGRIHRWLVSGTWPNISFTQESTNYGNILRAPFSGNANLAIGDADNDGQPDLAVGDQSGALKWYRNFLLQPGNNFAMDSLWHFNELLDQKTVRNWGPFVSPALADLNGDGYPELVLGTEGGGVEIFGNRLGPNTAKKPVAKPKWAVFPQIWDGRNPLKIIGETPEKITISDALGRPLWTHTPSGGQSEFSPTLLSNGCYFIYLQKGNNRETLRLIFQRN